jgi:hypothetical protein
VAKWLSLAGLSLSLSSSSSAAVASICHQETVNRKTIINCKKRYRFKKATLYEREVIKKQKFFIRWQKLPYSYNRWLGNRSLKATYSQIF